ncbi:sigma-54-dependent transcriptional regulator [Desulfothermus sp.]
MSGLKNKVIVVEDDEVMARHLKFLLKEKYEVKIAQNEEKAVKIAQSLSPLIILLDLALPPFPESPEVGLKLLSKFLEINPLNKVIVLTGHDTPENAKEALSKGAYDFLSKPVEETTLFTLIQRALYRQNLEKDYLEESKLIHLPIPIIAESPKMRALIRQVEKLAPLNVTCLIQGESGTGKEVIAKLIHALSDRANKPFLAVDCAAIPINLGEAELFGAEKGAYTGAVKKIVGKIAQAEGGTLFLDEIGEISIEMQAKLLRFLETKEYTPLGGKLHKADVRIVAATNRDLNKEVERGKFRLDLYYRLNQVNLIIPPLRERKQDIIPLAKYFLKQLSKEFGLKYIPVLSKEAEDALLRYSYPGNVRELKHVISRALILAEGKEIRLIHLGLDDTKSLSHIPVMEGYDLPKARAELDKLWLKTALKRNKGQISGAAKDLNIPRSTLYDLLKKYNIKH